MVFYLLLLIIIGLSGFNMYVRLKKSGRLANKVPGLTPYPFVGNILSFNVSSPEKLWLTIRDITRDYYPITRFWVTTQAVFSLVHPDDMEILFSSQKANEKRWVYNYLHPWLKTGLLTSNGEKWRQRRKILTPAFHFNILKKYMDITHEQGENLIKYLKSQGNESVENLIPFCSSLTLKIICEAAMGVALDKLDTKTMEKYMQAIYKLGELVIYRIPRPYIHDWMLKLVPFIKYNREKREALKVLHEFTNKVVKERKEYHERTNYKYLQGFTDDVEELKDEKDIYTGSKRRLAMLDLLLFAERDGLIDEEGIKEEVDTFTFEGHDTTAMAMTFTLMLLAEHTDAQNRIRAEVSEVFSKHHGKIGINEVQQFQYTERCIKESMRLYPPVATIFRYSDKNIKLKHGILPEASHTICHFYDLHRDPNFWSEPDKFDPDRFLNDNVKDRHPFAYLPFSAGSRNCIGQKFAINELKSIIGQILYNFYLEPIDRLENVKLIADLVLRPSKPVHIKFIQRRNLNI